MEGASDAVSVADEVVLGAHVAHAVDHTEAGIAGTLAGLGRVGTVLTADVDALAGN